MYIRYVQESEKCVLLHECIRGIEMSDMVRELPW
jgi:hypothetical protein